ncbi:MAG: methyl-accepting chemotaxis protein [Nitrospiria bacterium]
MGFRNLNIKTKMLITFIATIVVLMTVVLFVMSEVTKKGITKNVNPFLEVFSHIAANEIAVGLEFNDKAKVADAADQFTQEQVFSYIRVVDANRDEIYTYRKAGLAEIRSQEPTAIGKSEDELFKTVAVTANGKEIGAVTIGLSLEDLRKTLNAARFAVVTLSFLMVGIFVIIIFVIANLISKPIQRMTELSQKIARGDLTQEIVIESEGEIGRLAKAFSDMVVDLRLLVSQVKDDSNQIAEASGELSASSQQVSANSEQAKLQMSTVSSAIEQTSQNVGSVAAAAKQVMATINEISRNVLKSTEVSGHAVDVVTATSGTISKLGDSSAEIGDVIKVINSIAQQTNLLALNATIEAERAGEAGKGFAVVANEVKELAKATAEATEEISEKIAAIQSGTQGAVSAIGEIEAVIKETKEISLSIASAIEQQAATANEITRSAAEAASGTQEVVQSMAGVASFSKDTADEMSNVLIATQTLAQKGEALKELVGKFHVD